MRQRLDELRVAATKRMWRTRSDLIRARSGSAGTKRALSTLGSPDRSDLTSWNTATDEHHGAYRAHHFLPEGGVAIVCSSNRPGDLDNVATMVARQDVEELELVFVAHGDDFHPTAAERALDGLTDRLASVKVLHRPSSASLGECLNAAMENTDARFIAKFDSDDRYGAQYLADSLRAHSYADAALVGKHSYFVYLEATQEYLLRYPGKEFRPTSTLAGSTLVIDRNQTDDLTFEPISLGEDRAFIAACHRRGLTVFAADRFNHVLVRTGRHTWEIDRKKLLAKSMLLNEGEAAIRIER